MLKIISATLSFGRSPKKGKNSQGDTPDRAPSVPNSASKAVARQLSFTRQKTSEAAAPSTAAASDATSAGATSSGSVPTPPQLDFDLVMGDVDGYAQLLSFMERENTEENMLFVVEATRWRAAAAEFEAIETIEDRELIEEAETILDTFIDSGAAFELILPLDIARPLHQAKEVRATMFDDAIAEMHARVQRDSFVRFQATKAAGALASTHPHLLKVEETPSSAVGVTNLSFVTSSSAPATASPATNAPAAASAVAAPATAAAPGADNADADDAVNVNADDAQHNADDARVAAGVGIRHDAVNVQATRATEAARAPQRAQARQKEAGGITEAKAAEAKAAEVKAAEAKAAVASEPEEVAKRERVIELIKAAVSEILTAAEMPSMKMAIKAASAEAKKALSQDSALPPLDKVELEKLARDAYKLALKAKEEPPLPKVAMSDQVEASQPPRAPDAAAQPPGEPRDVPRDVLMPGAEDDEDEPVTTYVIAAEAAPTVSKLLGELVSAGDPLTDELLAGLRNVLEFDKDMLDDQLRLHLLDDGFVERRLASQLVPASPGLTSSVSGDDL